MWPREHGAYAQLGVPLLAALLVHSPTLPACLFALAAVCAFLANEPILVALGHRGRRARDAAGRSALVRAAVLVSLAAVAGTTALALGPAAARAMAIAAAVPAGGLVVLAWRRGQHSLGGELLAAIALPATGAVVMAAAGIPAQTAACAWTAWSLGYACTVIAVHRVLGRRRPGAPAIAAISLGVAVAVGAALRCSLALLALPLAVAALALAVRPPAPRRLRQIGVALVFASLASAALLVACV